MKKCYWVIMCGGFMGCRHFDDEKSATDAADLMTRLSGGSRVWTVRKIECR